MMTTPRITSRQISQAQKSLGDMLTSLNPTKSNAQRLVTSSAFQSRMRQMIIDFIGEYFILFTDEEAIAWIMKHACKSKADARQIVIGFRMKARAYGIADTVKIHAEVLPGCTVKQHLPLIGPCWENFTYLQHWDFPDTSTERALVSWVPAPLTDSTLKNVSEQQAMIAAFKVEAELPAWYDISFGSLVHVGGMALAHFTATGTDIFSGLFVRTDICDADGNRLKLHWYQGRLYCDRWHWGVARESLVAVVALGVVAALGHSVTRR